MASTGKHNLTVEYGIALIALILMVAMTILSLRPLSSPDSQRAESASNSVAKTTALDFKPN